MSNKLSVLAIALGITALGTTAFAQATPDVGNGYVEGVAQSAFGNVTSQSFGFEAGVHATPEVQVFFEVGLVRDSAPASLGANAQMIAGALTQQESGTVAYNAKQPITLGSAGIRYLFLAAPQINPYVMAGFGLARVKHDVTFSIDGSDVTGSMGDHGVVLGSDLSGSQTKLMLLLGGGVQWNAWRMLVVDLQYRFGRISTEGESTNLSRAGIGVGVRF